MREEIIMKSLYAAARAAYFSRVVARGMPRYIVVEATNRCNLQCPVCATSQYMKRPRGDMSLRLFETLLEQITWRVKMLNFGYSGEPLLNPQLLAMVARAKDKRIRCGFDTNGTLIKKYAEDIVRAKTYYVNIAFDGTSQESLEKYRRGSDYQALLEGVRALCGYKRSARTRVPIVALQFLVMRHNEGELSRVKTIARELGVDRLHIKSFNADLGFWLSREEKNRLIDEFSPRDPLYQRYTSTHTVKKRKFFIYPFTSPVILYNGDVSLCCLDFNGRHIAGTITREDLATIWRGRAYERLREQVRRGTLDICRQCSFDYSVNKTISF